MDLEQRRGVGEDEAFVVGVETEAVFCDEAAAGEFAGMRFAGTPGGAEDWMFVVRWLLKGRGREGHQKELTRRRDRGTGS